MTIQEENSKNTEVDYFKLTENEYQNVKSVSEYVYQLANNTLLETIQKEKWDEEDEKWIESRYHPVKSLWAKNRTTTSNTKGINLMRIDYAWDQEGNLKVLEINTCAQGGWILQSIKPELPYLETIGKPLPPPKGFIANYLVSKLGKRILFLVCKMKNFRGEHNLITEQIKELGGECLVRPFIPDDGENKENHMKQLMQDIHQFQPTGIHSRLVPRVVNLADSVIQIANLNLPQCISYESLFIAGDKSFLQLLHRKDERNVIPKSFVLDKSDLDKNLHLIEKDLAVLKPGDLALGMDIQFGKNCDDDTWKQHIQKAMASDNCWIMQELCYLKRKNGKFEDLVCYIADGEVKAVGSRISSSEIVNVFAGGSWQSAVIVSE
ncbi:unnamed protein product [Cunninghamella blakesleeana]